MKLTDAQKLDKQTRDNVTRLKNRILSEYQFRKWRNYHSYLSSIGRDKDFIDKQPDRQLTFDELKGLLNVFQEEALKISETVFLQSSTIIHNASSSAFDKSEGEESDRNASKEISRDEKAQEKTEETFNASNNYGLKESKKEVASLLWFQKKASAELLKGFY